MIIFVFDNTVFKFSICILLKLVGFDLASNHLIPSYFFFFLFIEGGTIKTLRNNLDCLEELTTLLDCETPGMKNWLHFACKLGVPKEDCDNLKPKGNPSPTRALMEHIVQVDPGITVKRFMEALIKMQRIDVVNTLRKLFLGNSLNYNYQRLSACVGLSTAERVISKFLVRLSLSRKLNISSDLI